MPPVTMCPLTANECSACPATVGISGSVTFGGNPGSFCFGVTASFSFTACKGDGDLAGDDCAYGDLTCGPTYEYPCDPADQSCFFGVEVFNDGDCKILWSSSGVPAGTSQGTGNRVLASCEGFGAYAASNKLNGYSRFQGVWQLSNTAQFGTSITGQPSVVVCPDAIFGTTNGEIPGGTATWTFTVS